MTDESAARQRTRRRRRAGSRQGPVPAAPDDSNASAAPARAEPLASSAKPDRPRERAGDGESGRRTPGRRPRGDAREAAADRGLRDLVGAGPSQLGVSRALRGRDVDRPTAEELAQAEQDVVLIRRHWRPDPSC